MFASTPLGYREGGRRPHPDTRAVSSWPFSCTEKISGCSAEALTRDQQASSLLSRYRAAFPLPESFFRGSLLLPDGRCGGEQKKRWMWPDAGKKEEKTIIRRLAGLSSACVGIFDTPPFSVHLRPDSPSLVFLIPNRCIAIHRISPLFSSSSFLPPFRKRYYKVWRVWKFKRRCLALHDR